MPRTLLSVVEEFRRSSEAQHRKNAATALALIADDEATSQLVDLTLTDPDLSVRERAEQEIFTLEPRSRDVAIDNLKGRLKDTTKRQAAYGILGRLRSFGLNIRFRRRPVLSWVRLTLGLNGQLYPLRNWSFRMRSWKSGFQGGVAAAVFITIFFLRTGRSQDFRGFTTLLLVTLLLSPAVAIIATQRTCPINLYLDHLFGFLSETLSIAILASVGFTLIFFFYVVVLSRGYFYWEWSSFFLMPLILGGFAGLVRAGTIIAYGRFFDRRWNKLAQIVVGVATGFVGLTVVNFFTWKFGALNDLMEAMWVFVLPISFVTASAFAAIDNHTFRIRPVSGRLGTLLCILVLLLLLTISAVVLKQGRNGFPDHSSLPTLDPLFDRVFGQRYGIPYEPLSP